MSAYKRAIDRIRSHNGFLEATEFETQLLSCANSESMATFIKSNGCLITARHDLNFRFSGRDFLVNLMSEMVIIHVSPRGEYTLHRWEKTTSCSAENRLPKEKESYLLALLFELEKAA